MKYFSPLRCATLCALLPAGLACANDGMLDTSFGATGKSVVFFDQGGTDADRASAVAVQPDGEIIVVGTVSYDNGTGPIKAIGVTRLLPNGHALDTTFGSGGKKVLVSPGDDLNATAVLLQPDGKIVIGGWFEAPADDLDMLLYRINADGNADIGFGVLGRAVIPFNSATNDVLSALALQPDGKIVGAGYTQFSGDDLDFAVIRLNTNGSLDTSFSGDGKNSFAFDDGAGNTDFAQAVTIDLYGNILVAGGATADATGYDFAAARFTSNGALDTSFGNSGGVRLPSFAGSDDDVALGVALSYDNLLPLYTLAGYRHFGGVDYDFAAIQLDSSGDVTPGFGVQSYLIDLNGIGTDIGRAIVAENNGVFDDATRFTIAGYAFNGTSVNYDFAAIRVLADGMLDPGFGTGGKTTVRFDFDASPPSSHDDYGQAIALQANRVVVAGTIGRQGNNGADADFGITRLTADLIFSDGFEM